MYQKKQQEELKPCPFCGKSDFLEVLSCREVSDCQDCAGCNNDYEAYTVVCNSLIGGCGATGGYFVSPAKAIENWNARSERTCDMIYRGERFASYWECSECEACCDDAGTHGLNYCPGCGARVVEKRMYGPSKYTREEQ